MVVTAFLSRGSPDHQAGFMRDLLERPDCPSPLPKKRNYSEHFTLLLSSRLAPNSSLKIIKSVGLGVISLLTLFLNAGRFPKGDRKKEDG